MNSGLEIENFIIEKFGAKRIKGSGSVHNDIDFLTDEYGVELKTTINSYYRVSEKVCEKIYQMSTLRGLKGLLMVIYDVHPLASLEELLSNLYVYEIKYEENEKTNKSVELNKERKEAHLKNYLIIRKDGLKWLT